MMKLMKAMAVAMTMVGASGAAHAIDLRNEDETEHEVVVTSSSMTRDVAMRGLSLSLVVCVGECSFEVPGVGLVRARGNDVVTIRGGTITRTPPAADTAAR
ncbi:MAG: hypothetical protein U1F43_21650 [Myxococcota bacterium]